MNACNKLNANEFFEVGAWSIPVNSFSADFITNPPCDSPADILIVIRPKLKTSIYQSWDGIG